MARLSTKIAQRVTKFLELLERETLDNEIPIEEFEAIVRKEGETGKSVDHLIRYALDRVEEALPSGRYLHRSDKSVTLSSRASSIFDRRLRRAETEKSLLAEGLLVWLFGTSSYPGNKRNPITIETHFSDPGTQYDTLTDSVTCPHPSGHPVDLWGRFFHSSSRPRTLTAQRLYRRLNHIRRAANLVWVVDAGTTNLTFMEKLLATHTVPFRTPVFGMDEYGVELKGEEATRIISPTIITNSIPVADAVARSRHRRSISLQIVGGTERFERRSICGAAAVLWLRACLGAGVIASADLAILGTTGYRSNFLGGTSGFGCDDPTEANLKMEMLKLAANGLRVVILDAKKFISGEFNCCFAPLTAATLDLVVVGLDHTPTARPSTNGNGNGNGNPSPSTEKTTTPPNADADLERRLTEFCREANNNGVGVIIVRKAAPHASPSEEPEENGTSEPLETQKLEQEQVTTTAAPDQEITPVTGRRRGKGK